MNIRRTAALVFAAVSLLSAPAQAAFAMCNATMYSQNTGIRQTVRSVGRSANWAGVSNVSQFTDEQGRFCFAVDGGDHVNVYRTEQGHVVGTPLVLANPYDSFGGAVCGADGSLYMVWGRNNAESDTSLPTIFVSRYSADGELQATAGGNGSEGMAYYYTADFNTMQPFNGGNCDVALNGSVLMVNYARKMYNGHQSNTVFAVNTDTMTVLDGYAYYNSHSFDQRVTPYGDSFLLASHGDCYPRCFTLAAANGKGNGKSAEMFHFWVEQGALDQNDMWKMNKTRARLGNVLETEAGAALIGASARSLSEAADSEPHDVFVQVLDPATGLFVTEGERSGLGGNNGDQSVTDHGVRWLTALEDGETVDVVQAANIDGGRIIVLYELLRQGSYDSTWATVLNADGSTFLDPMQLGSARLNADEDPVFADGAVQWAANANGNSLIVYRLALELAETGTLGENGELTWGYLNDRIAIIDGTWSLSEQLIAASYDSAGRLLGTASLERGEADLPQSAAEVRLFWLDSSGSPKCAAASAR